MTACDLLRSSGPDFAPYGLTSEAMDAAQTDARLALASAVLITKQFEDTPYEVTLPRDHIDSQREEGLPIPQPRSEASLCALTS